jgi:hypothetical protein
VETALRVPRDLRPVTPAVVETDDALWLTAELNLEYPL